MSATPTTASSRENTKDGIAYDVDVSVIGSGPAGAAMVSELMPLLLVL